jgi:hypothetical protein
MNRIHVHNVNLSSEYLFVEYYGFQLSCGLKRQRTFFKQHRFAHSFVSFPPAPLVHNLRKF